MGGSLPAALHLSSIDLAREFYHQNELAIERIAKHGAAKERWVNYDDDEFDGCMVKIGQMSHKASEAVSRIEAEGLIRLRNRLRMSINAAARKGDGVPRPFCIEAKDKKWRIELTERFVENQPEEIKRGIDKKLTHAAKALEQVMDLAVKIDFLAEGDKTMWISQLSTTYASILSSMKTSQMLGKQMPQTASDLRKMRRELMGMHPLPRKRRKAKLIP